MGSQTYIYGFLLYFFGITTVISLISIGGGFSGNEFISSGGYTYQQLSNITGVEAPEGDTSLIHSYSIKTYFKDLFSFFVFNISIYKGEVLMQYLWLIRAIFVYIPLTMLAIAMYFSLPTVTS